MPRDERQKRLYHHILSRLQVAYTYLPAAPFATYATGWLMVYALRAVRQRTAPAFLQALRDLPDTLSAARRTPVQPATRAYLRAHYGRLWF